MIDTAPIRVFWKDRDSVYLGCNVVVARAWGHLDDFEANMRARQDEGKVKSVAERIRKEGPRVLACPSCAARIPATAMGRYVCTFCGSTLEV